MAQTEDDKSADDVETLKALCDRLKPIAWTGRGARLRPDEVTEVYCALHRAFDLQDDPLSLDREGAAATFILTGEFPPDVDIR